MIYTCIANVSKLKIKNKKWRSFLRYRGKTGRRVFLPFPIPE